MNCIQKNAQCIIGNNSTLTNASLHLRQFDNPRKRMPAAQKLNYNGKDEDIFER